MEEEKLLQVPVYSIGLRKNLVLGCDRKTIMTVAMLMFVMVFAWDFYWLVDLIAVLIWLVSLALLRAAAKADPQHMDVFKRYLRYRPYFFPAQSTPFCRGRRRNF